MGNEIVIAEERNLLRKRVNNFLLNSRRLQDIPLLIKWYGLQFPLIYCWLTHKDRYPIIVKLQAIIDKIGADFFMCKVIKFTGEHGVW